MITCDLCGRVRPVTIRDRYKGITLCAAEPGACRERLSKLEVSAALAEFTRPAYSSHAPRAVTALEVIAARPDDHYVHLAPRGVTDGWDYDVDPQYRHTPIEWKGARL